MSSLLVWLQTNQPKSAPLSIRIAFFVMPLPKQQVLRLYILPMNSIIGCHYHEFHYICHEYHYTTDYIPYGRNIGGFLSKPPIRQNKFPAKISGYTVFYMDVGNFNSELQVQPPHSHRHSVALWWHTYALAHACMGFETLLKYIQIAKI